MLSLMIVHFICRGNVLRSIIAEAYLKSLRVPGITVLSSGSVADEFRASNIELGYIENSRQILARHGLARHSKDVPDQLTPDRLNGDQLVICMNRIVFDGGDAAFSLPVDTVFWDITDIGEAGRIVDLDASRRVFEEEIYREIIAKVDELVASGRLTDN